MRSPLSHPSRPYHSRQQICKILPNQGKVEFALSYDCELELYIASHTYNDVSVRINNQHVYNFWNFLIEDKQRVYDILLSDWFKFGKQDFHMLQKDWSTWTDPFHRAALFFILSAASSKGIPSAGKLDLSNMHALTYSRLKLFKRPANLELILDDGDIHSLQKSDADAVVILGGDYHYNTLEYGLPQGAESVMIKHDHIYSNWDGFSDNTYLLYNYHPELMTKYQHSHITMIDKYGLSTKWQNECKELIIAKR